MQSTASPKLNSILEVTAILNSDTKPPDYIKLFEGNVKDQLENRKDFLEYTKIQKDLIENKKSRIEIIHITETYPIVGP